MVKKLLTFKWSSLEVYSPEVPPFKFAVHALTFIIEIGYCMSSSFLLQFEMIENNTGRIIAKYDKITGEIAQVVEWAPSNGRVPSSNPDWGGFIIHRENICHPPVTFYKASVLKDFFCVFLFRSIFIFCHKIIFQSFKFTCSVCYVL